MYFYGSYLYTIKLSRKTINSKLFNERTIPLQVNSLCVLYILLQRYLFFIYQLYIIFGLRMRRNA